MSPLTLNTEKEIVVPVPVLFSCRERKPLQSSFSGGGERKCGTRGSSGPMVGPPLTADPGRQPGLCLCTQPCLRQAPSVSPHAEERESTCIFPASRLLDVLVSWGSRDV